MIGALKKLIKLVVILVVAGVLIHYGGTYLGNSLKNDGPNKGTVFCNKVGGDATRIVNLQISNGVVRDIDVSALRVEDAMWARLSHDAKISLAAAAYCKSGAFVADGNIYFVKGFRDGKIRGTVSGGQWFPG